MPAGTSGLELGPGVVGRRLTSQLIPGCALRVWKKGMLAAVATSGHLALGLGGKRGRRVFSFRELVASNSIFYILGLKWEEMIFQVAPPEYPKKSIAIPSSHLSIGSIPP